MGSQRHPHGCDRTRSVPPPARPPPSCSRACAPPDAARRRRIRSVGSANTSNWRTSRPTSCPIRPATSTANRVAIDGGAHLRTSGAEDLLGWTDEQWEQTRRK
jgi:hypothetical protein